MAKQELLNRVYQTISALHKSGKNKLSVMEVAKLSGVARATINQKSDPDWEVVRGVIKSTFDPKQSLEESNVVFAKPHHSFEDVHRRLEELEQQLSLLRDRANTTYDQLMDRVQYYFALASEKPAKQVEMAKVIQELNYQKRQNAILRSDLKAALAESKNPAVSGLVSSKLIIDIPVSITEPEAIRRFLEKLDSLICENRSSLITAAYIMFGLPMCGKSCWIENHKPHTPGVSLYISGACDTASIRSLIISRLTKEFSVPIHCVRFDVPLDVCIARAERQFNGAALELNISLMKTAASRVEEIQFTENFDSIILA